MILILGRKEIMSEEKLCAVVSLKERRRKLTTTLLCKCRHVTGDDDTQLLECDHCGRFFTAWNWLMHMYREKIHMQIMSKSLREEVTQLASEIERLKKERAYLTRKVRLS